MAGKKLASVLLRGLRTELGQQALLRAVDTAQELARRAGRRRLRLAVTGLSRSGKTIFITALVNQLLHASGGHHRLPRLRVLQQERLLGVSEAPQPDSTVPTFRYHDYLAELRAEPPRWPGGTVDISQLRLLLRSRPQGALSGLVNNYQELALDITDYPGEWLVDLPLLSQDFAAWSQAMWRQAEQPHLAGFSAPWRDYLRGLNTAAAVSREQYQRALELFREYLLAAKAAGFNYLQPGRILLPGALAGSPAVGFCPCPPPAGALQPDGLYARLAERYALYQNDVIKPFYRQHFSGFDRQVVLVDLMYALQQGPAHFADTRQTLNTLLQSFRHGRGGPLARLFSPKIDRLLFAATKVDQLNRAQYPNLQRLLQAMLADTGRQAQFADARTLCLALASVKATETVIDRTEIEAKADGGREFVRGRLLEDDFTAPLKELYYPPGAVPKTLPSESSWRERPFVFYGFHPPPAGPADRPLPHVNMDAALEFLLGDRL